MRKFSPATPFGSLESSILYVLNVAAKQLQEGDTVYAMDLVSFALDILDDGVRYGWYSASDIEPLKRIILTEANAGMREAGAPPLDESPS